MKRLLLICLATMPLSGLTRPVANGDRIAVLQTQERFAGAEERVANTICAELRTELRSRGLKAFDARATFDDVQRGGGPVADYYVEVVSAAAADRPIGAVGTNAGGIGVDVGVVVSRVAAELRLYDGRTLALIDRFNLQHKSAGVVPAGLGVGTRPFWAFIAFPFVHYDGYRAAARDVARQAADLIAGR